MSISGRKQHNGPLKPLRTPRGVVYAKPPFGGPERVLKYLSRYTHRVAISNRRLLFVGDGIVRFAWKDSADHNTQKEMTETLFVVTRRRCRRLSGGSAGGFRKTGRFPGWCAAQP